jgi:hypothetical protein
METLISVSSLLAIIIAIAFAVYRVLTPQPLPGIPHNKLAWLQGDIPFLMRFAKESGLSLKGFDIAAEKLGPIFQVGPSRSQYVQLTSFILPMYRSSLARAILGSAK